MGIGGPSFAARKGPPCILIVEDEVLVAQLISDLVCELGYAVTGLAHDAHTASQQLAKRNYDAVLLDMRLGGLRGHEIADVLQQTGTPFAFVSGYDCALEPRHQHVPLLGKPFTSDQLRLLLEQLIGPCGAEPDEIADAG